MALTLTITNVGRAALINAANTGTAPVTIAQVGLSGSAVAPDKAATALPGEFKRIATIAGDVVADDTIHVIVRDETGDAYTIRSLGLYLSDGTLFGLYGQAPVLLEKSSQAIVLLSVDVRFEDIDAHQISFGDASFLNPPATTERQGVVELATLAETLAGLDDRRTPAAKMVKDAVFQWLDARLGANNSGVWHPGNDGAGSGLDADLLDGQQGSYYSNIAARLGYTPVQQGTGVGQMVNSVKLGWDGNWLRGTIDQTDLGRIIFHQTLDGGVLSINGASMRRNGFTLFGPDNDGSGSGLDADMLDGLHGGQFLRNHTNNWIYDESGQARLFFSPGADTYARIKGAFRWQNSENGDVASVDESGNLWLNGQIDATRLIARANGDGMAVKIGDDAWIGDVNTPSTIGVRGVGDWRAGFMQFGNSPFRLGCNADDGTLRYNGAQIWDSGNDGAGSGLDADMLDGWQRDDIRHWNNLLGKPFNYSGQGGQPSWLWGTNDGNNYYVWNPANFSVSWANSAGNADTVDGMHAWEFARASDFSNNLSSPGWRRLPDGTIEQWCISAVQQNVESTTFVTFPIQFPNAVLDVQLTTRVDFHSIENDMWYQLVGDPQLHGCIIGRARSDGDGDRPTYCRVRAIGR